MNALKAVGVSRKYGKVDVLKDFSLELQPGDFVALMGPSGSGKSTFLHIAAGLLAADSGSVEIGGEEITRMSDSSATKFRRRHVGVVFQAFNLLPDRSVRENILLPAKLDGRQVELELLKGLADRLDIADKLDRRADELSGGEQQRVAIARALVTEPDVVLADEPTGNLDAKNAKEICEMLKALSLGSRTAILVVTHDLMVAASARKVCFLKDGRIAATCDTEGDPSVVSSRYLEINR